MNAETKKDLLLGEVHRLENWNYLPPDQQKQFLQQAAAGLCEHSTVDENSTHLRAVMNQFGLKEKEASC